MRYVILLKLEYKYAHTVANARHILRLMPRSMPGVQRQIAAALDITPKPSFQSVRQDFFGTTTHIVHYDDDHDRVAFNLRARVERAYTPPEQDTSCPVAGLAEEIAAVRDLSPDSPLHYLGPSPRIPDFAPFREFAASVLAPGMSVRDLMIAMSDAIRRRMRFDAKATDVDTSPQEALSKGRGVCQDYSQIMIAALRALGVPAGYVSGFLRTIPPPGKPRLPGSDAMHAWVRVWCGAAAGWHEYDPTNALEVRDDHILVAYGRDYSDVAPIRGVSRTAGEQVGKHTVDVIPEPADSGQTA